MVPAGGMGMSKGLIGHNLCLICHNKGGCISLTFKMSDFSDMGHFLAIKKKDQKVAHARKVTHLGGPLRK